MSVFKRILGVLLIIISAVSLVLSLVTIVGVWNLRGPLANGLNSSLALVDDTLTSTGQALIVVDETLQTIGANVTAAQSTFETLGKTINDSAPALESTAQLLTTSLPVTLASAQDALSASAESAKVVDGVLGLLSDLPFSNIEYDPEVTLSDSLSSIGESLTGLPESLEQLGSRLGPTVDNLPALGRSLSQLGGTIAQLQANLDSTRQLMTSYQQLIGRYQGLIRSVQQFTSTLVLVVPIVVTFFAFWLAIVQFLALLKGWEWVRGEEPEPVVVAATPAPIASLAPATPDDSPALQAAQEQPDAGESA